MKEWRIGRAIHRDSLVAWVNMEFPKPIHAFVIAPNGSRLIVSPEWFPIEPSLIGTIREALEKGKDA